MSTRFVDWGYDRRGCHRLLVGPDATAEKVRQELQHASSSDPADLAGLRIGTPGRFGSSWHALLALLDAGGLTPDDVTIREYPQFDQAAGLLAGDVDLITGFRNNEPLRLEAEGMTPDLLTVDDIAPLPGPGVFTSDTLLADERRRIMAISASGRSRASGARCGWPGGP